MKWKYLQLKCPIYFCLKNSICILCSLATYKTMCLKSFSPWFCCMKWGTKGASVTLFLIFKQCSKIWTLIGLSMPPMYRSWHLHIIMRTTLGILHVEICAISFQNWVKILSLGDWLILFRNFFISSLFLMSPTFCRLFLNVKDIVGNTEYQDL